MSTQNKNSTQFMLDMPFSEAVHRYSRVNTKDLTEIDEQSSKAHPFVKWVGGKRSIIIELTSRLPEKFNSYFEPFVGGGALYFEIQENIQKAYLSDTNIDLLITYQAIKNNPQELLKTLKRHAENHNSDYYYEVRAQHYLKDPIEVAARFIYLNRTCFNGLYRVNKKGEFNVPMGTYKNPIIVNEPNIIDPCCQFRTVKLGRF